MAYQRQIPGGPFFNGSDANQHQLPGGPYVNDTESTGTTIAGSLGTAAASGYTAGVAQTTSIAGALGTAAASGYTANVAQTTTILCAVGTANAVGYGATVGGAGTTISCAVGSVAAVGYRSELVIFTQAQLNYLLAYMEANMAIWTQQIEGGKTAAEMLRIIASSAAGTSSKAGNTVTFKGIDGTTDRIVGTFDAQGNRTGAVLDGG